MSVWRVCERAELGKVGRQWELKRDGQLSAGRSSDSDIHVQSMSVENRHALFEWNMKMQAFTVKDLGSVNGTYINNRPISRQGSAMLNHGDVVRFGYEKTHVFRIEEKFPSPAHSVAKATTPQHTVRATNSSVTTQTSPRNDIVPASAPPLSAASTVTPHNPNTQRQVASPQTIILPQTYIHQQSPVPLVVPQFGYPGSPPVSLHPTPMGHVTPPVPLHPVPTGHVTIPQASSAFHPISPTQFLQVSTPPPAPVMSSESPQSVDELESSGSSYTKSQRSDGRRAVELSNSPSLSKVSKLYGKPSWWGEEKATEKENDQEFEFVKPGSQILRDYDRRGRSPSCEDPLHGSSRPHRHSASEDLRFQVLSNSTECASPASTWVVDFGSGDSNAKKRPSRLDRLEQHRPRSADPSPNRSPQIKKDLLPTTVSLRRSSSTHRSPSSSPRRSPVMTRRPQGMSIRNKQQGSGGGGESAEQSLFRSKTVVKRPPSGGGSLTRTKTTVKKGSPAHSSSGSARARKSSLETVSQTADVKTSKKKQNGGVKETSSRKGVSSNETYITEPVMSSSLEDSQSQSDVSLSASGQVGGGTADTADLKSSSASEMQKEGASQPNSARKQWTSEQTQVPDGLMLASIEARIRQLSKLAHATARQLSCLQRSLQDVPGVIVHSIPPTSPLGTQRGVDQRLPEWRFNKEGDSIFRGMRTVEKWLKDIEATINSIQVGTAADGGDTVSVVECPTESTDFQPDYETTESEVEAILQDSIDQFYSFSDTEDS